MSAAVPEPLLVCNYQRRARRRHQRQEREAGAAGEVAHDPEGAFACCILYIYTHTHMGSLSLSLSLDSSGEIDKFWS